MILSVIVPVYNVEAYLAGCLDSLLACDLTDCEIILSFRDSQDRSKEICDQYCSKFSFVRLISQEGTGLSNARNCAMRIACGDYLLFVRGPQGASRAAPGNSCLHAHGEGERVITLESWEATIPCAISCPIVFEI